MDEIYLTSEELAEYPVEDFIGKWTFNNKTCGTGKSRKIYEIIEYGITHEMKMMVCLPTHDNIEEFMSRMTDHRDQTIQLWGKTAYCQLRNSANAYLIGCRNCTHKTNCLYIRQFTIARSSIRMIPQIAGDIRKDYSKNEVIAEIGLYSSFANFPLFCFRYEIIRKCIFFLSKTD
ncbi:MAG: hypothetical protein ACW99L_15555 [Promethearchaeota archaeon]|jgi:hypothetical protein